MSWRPFICNVNAWNFQASAKCHPAIQGVAGFFAHGQGSAGDATHAPSLGYSLGEAGVLEIERGLVQFADTLWGELAGGSGDFGAASIRRSHPLPSTTKYCGVSTFLRVARVGLHVKMYLRSP